MCEQAREDFQRLVFHHNGKLIPQTRAPQRAFHTKAKGASLFVE